MIKYNDKTKHIERRVKEIPKFTDQVFRSFAKQDAVKFIRQFRKNIKNETYIVDALIEPTVDFKEDEDYKQPDTPLYGKGKDDPFSYYNMFRLQKLKNGYKAAPRKARHHTSDLTLEHLLNIHEYGCSIPVTDKMRNYLHYIGIHLRKDTAIIRIPPRPIAYLTYRDVTFDWAKRRMSAQRAIKKAVKAYIQDADESYINKIREREESVGKEFEK